MASILVLSKRMEMGGTEKALIALLKYLVKEGHRIDLLLLNKKGPTLHSIPEGVSVYEADFSDSDIIEKMAGKQIDSVRFSFIKRAIAKALKTIYRQDETKKNLYPFLLKRVKKANIHYDILFDFHGYGYFFTAYGAKIVNADRKAVWFHDNNIFWAEWAKEYYKNYDKIFRMKLSEAYSCEKIYSSAGVY